MKDNKLAGFERYNYKSKIILVLFALAEIGFKTQFRDCRIYLLTYPGPRQHQTSVN